MAQQEYPTFQGVAPSWSDLSISFPIYGGATVKLTDIAALKWSDSVEIGDFAGTNGGRKSRRTTGKYSCEASCTFTVDGWKAFQAKLAEKNPKITLVGFDVLAMYTPPDSTEICKVKIAGCRVSGRSGDMSDGTDAALIEVALNPMRIEENGVNLL